MNALWMTHAEWKARELNRLFLELGQTGKRGQITAETVSHGERTWPRSEDYKQYVEPDDTGGK